MAEHGNLFESTFTDQPSELAIYRAEVDLTIDPTLLPLSNRTSVAWMFKSAHADGVVRLPLMTVKINAPLDSFNRAKPNTWHGLTTNAAKSEEGESRSTGGWPHMPYLRGVGTYAEAGT